VGGCCPLQHCCPDAFTKWDAEREKARTEGFVVVLCVLFVPFAFCIYGTARRTVYWSITSAFPAIQVQTALHKSQLIFLLRLNMCNDLAKAMKALEGKKERKSTHWEDRFGSPNSTPFQPKNRHQNKSNSSVTFSPAESSGVTKLEL